MLDILRIKVRSMGLFYRQFSMLVILRIWVRAMGYISSLLAIFSYIMTTRYYEGGKPGQI